MKTNNKIPRCKNGKQHSFGIKDLQICKYCHLIWNDRFNTYDKSMYILTDNKILNEIKKLRKKIEKWTIELDLNHKPQVEFVSSKPPKYATKLEDTDSKLMGELKYENEKT